MEVDSEIVKDSLSLYMNLVECTDFSTPNDTTPGRDNLWLDTRDSLALLRPVCRFLTTLHLVGSQSDIAGDSDIVTCKGANRERAPDRRLWFSRAGGS
jgi:hypothetical protein